MSSADRPSVMQAFTGLSADEMEILTQADRFAQAEAYPLAQRMDDEEWWPADIFQKIGAAVSDIGGSMSHMAIVAREYGLPAVVGTGSATTKIKDGQRIRVDGGRGTVTILHDEKVLEDA